MARVINIDDIGNPLVPKTDDKIKDIDTSLSLKTNDEICIDSYEEYSYASHRNENGDIICDCIDGYGWNSLQTKRIA